MGLFSIFGFILLMTMVSGICCDVTTTNDHTSSVHFDYKTDNGHSRTEDIRYNKTASEDENKNDVAKAVEYRGGYSFISADGYEYSVLYKANKGGFYPYVTARKIKDLE